LSATPKTSQVSCFLKKVLFSYLIFSHSPPFWSDLIDRAGAVGLGSLHMVLQVGHLHAREDARHKGQEARPEDKVDI